MGKEANLIRTIKRPAGHLIEWVPRFTSIWALRVQSSLPSALDTLNEECCVKRTERGKEGKKLWCSWLGSCQRRITSLQSVMIYDRKCNLFVFQGKCDKRMKGITCYEEELQMGRGGSWRRNRCLQNYRSTVLVEAVEWSHTHTHTQAHTHTRAHTHTHIVL